MGSRQAGVLEKNILAIRGAQPASMENMAHWGGSVRDSCVILVTGATGFVGRAVLARLTRDRSDSLRAAVRRPVQDLPPGVEIVHVGDLGPDTDWRAAVRGIEILVHTAARVHVMRDAAADPLEEFRRTNVSGTLRLARQAASAGVRRFVFISSIKVNGEQTVPGRPYAADDVPAPVDSYGISKHEAESALREVARSSGMEFVIIRPVLVYGPGVKGNFHSMMRWLHKGIPLPLGSIHNARSLVALDNLVDLIATCLHHPAAANQTFLVSDGEDTSTPDLLRRTSAALGRPARLLPIPAWALKALATAAGKRDVAQRLCGSLQVDISRTRKILGWAPRIGLDDALRHTALDFGARLP